MLIILLNLKKHSLYHVLYIFFLSFDFTKKNHKFHPFEQLEKREDKRGKTNLLSGFEWRQVIT